MATNSVTENRSLPKKVEVVIIGGGIVGASIAYNLAKKGLNDVIILEKGLIGEGSTGKCAGGIRTQFSTRINLQFSKLSIRIFEQFEDEFGKDPEFQRIGYLFLSTTHEQWSILQANSRSMESEGFKAELFTPQQIKDNWPFISVKDLSGGSYTKNDGYAGPYEVLQGFIKGARRSGVLIREGMEVTGINSENGAVTTVETSTGEKINTNIIVNAAGPYASGIAGMLGLDLPVIPLRRQLFFTNPFNHLPQKLPMIIDLEHGWYMRREGKGLLLAGPQDKTPSFNDKCDFEARIWTADRSMRRIPALSQVGIVNGWSGLYEISPDNHAIIGSFPEMKGFLCVNGFSGHGFMHAPATGIVVSELILKGNAESIDIHPLRPTRFRENDLIYEPITAFKKEVIEA
jgi:sarcosine oxidase, subunit beta